MKLLEGEEKILESDMGQFYLTTHRACFVAQTFGRAIQKTILLEDLDSCEVEYRSKPIFIVLGIGTPILTVMSGNSQFLPLAIGIGIVFAVLFYLSIKSLVILKSRSNKIELNIKGIKMKNIQELINEVDKAKIQRKETLTRRGT